MGSLINAPDRVRTCDVWLWELSSDFAQDKELREDFERTRRRLDMSK